MQLSPRLHYITSNIKDDQSFIDIAADHGYVALQLAKNNANRTIIVSDIAKLPLASAQKNFMDANITNAEFRLGSGFEVLKLDERLDVAIIAGIGGRLMVDILNHDIVKTKQVNTLYLQANIGMSLVREWLYEHNYQLLQDRLIMDGNHIYECLIAQCSNAADPIYDNDIQIRNNQYVFSPFLTKNDEQTLQHWLQNKLTYFEQQIKQLQKSNNYEAVKDKIQTYQQLSTYGRRYLK